MTQIHQLDMQSEDLGECSMSTCLQMDPAHGDLEEDLELDRASLSVFCCVECLATYKTETEFIIHECQLSKEELEEVSVYRSFYYYYYY